MKRPKRLPKLSSGRTARLFWRENRIAAKLEAFGPSSNLSVHVKCPRAPPRLRRRQNLLACRRSGNEKRYDLKGKVVAVEPDKHLVTVSHEEVKGYMPAMTMGFRVASPKIQEAVSVGDEVRFTLRGVLPNVAVTTIEKTK